MARKLARPARIRPTDGEREAKTGQVQSLTRALRIMRVLADSADGMTLTEVAQANGLAPSTAHRLLTTLQHERFARFDAQTSLWQVGVQAFTVGNAFTRTRDVVTVARPYMRRLMEESGETVNLYLENDGEVICIGQIECRQLMRTIARPGGRANMHCSGAGKAILAWLPDIRLEQILAQHGLPRITGHTVHSTAQLREDLDLGRARGYVLDDEENAVGLRCVAAPVFDEYGTPLAGISLSGPTARIGDERLAELGTMVSRIADEVTVELGGRRPKPD